MAATARFRFKGLHDPDENGNTGCQVAASGYLAVGFPGLHYVEPDDVFEVSDVKPVIGHDENGEPIYGDCGRRQLPRCGGSLRGAARQRAAIQVQGQEGRRSTGGRQREAGGVSHDHHDPGRPGDDSRGDEGIRLWHAGDRRQLGADRRRRVARPQEEHRAVKGPERVEVHAFEAPGARHDRGRRQLLDGPRRQGHGQVVPGSDGLGRDRRPAGHHDRLSSAALPGADRCRVLLHDPEGHPLRPLGH